MNLTKNGKFITILLSNLIPVIGVLFLGWSIHALLLLYWMESVIVGLFNLLKMILAQGSFVPNKTGKTGLIVFFMLHYFGFMIGLGIFISIVAIPGMIHENGIPDFPLILTGIFISYGAGFVTEYIMSGEYKTRTADSLFFTPYGRVFVMGLVIAVGFGLAKKYHISENMAFLAVLCIGRFLLDMLTFFILDKIKVKSGKTDWTEPD